jgi:low temperature requirement protein LtrA
MARRLHVEVVGERASATTLELFFDLVFVFALTQVTAQMADDLTPHGLLRGLLVFGLLWWSWVGYSWLGNVVRADEGATRGVLLVAMSVMFVLALAIPEAFTDLPGGLPGPYVVVACYFLFRLLHLVMFWAAGADDAGLRRQITRFAPSMLGASVLLLAAAATSGTLQTALWAGALAFDYGWTALIGARGWRIRSARHFAERHGLIVIVGLGESIVAIGVGVAALPVSWPIVVASVLGLAVSSALWWIYFDTASWAGEQALEAVAEADRPRLARDAYTFFHLPLVGGVVVLALGLKKVLEYVGDAEAHGLADPLPPVALAALFGGAVLFLLAHAGFVQLTRRAVSVAHLAAAVALVAAYPLALRLPALADLGVVVTVTVAVAIADTRGAEERYRLRHEVA